MPITEIVIPSFIPGVGKEATEALRANVHYISEVPGQYAIYRGHMLRHNGKDVGNENLPLLAVEWDKPESFHRVYPASEKFQNFLKAIIPFAAEKAVPKLFQPDSGHLESYASFGSGITQILMFTPSVPTERTDEIWAHCLATLKDQLHKVTEWTGTGIENADGVRVALLGWNTIESINNVHESHSVQQALVALREVGSLDEYIAKFEV